MFISYIYIHTRNQRIFSQFSKSLSIVKLRYWIYTVYGEKVWHKNAMSFFLSIYSLVNSKKTILCQNFKEIANKQKIGNVIKTVKLMIHIYILLLLQYIPWLVIKVYCYSVPLFVKAFYQGYATYKWNKMSLASKNALALKYMIRMTKINFISPSSGVLVFVFIWYYSHKLNSRIHLDIMFGKK